MKKLLVLRDILIANQWKLATAESCTGGGVSEMITSIPGSSDWFERGFVSYSNASKIEMLGVKASTLAQFGAVSEQVAKEMAEGALKNSHAQISLAVTGIAGPDGGTPDKPVGTVWFAWSGQNFPTKTQIQHFDGDRSTVRALSIKFVLEGLSDILFPSSGEE